MFVYTVYGTPGVAAREPGRKVNAVSRVERARPTERSWVVQKQNEGQAQKAYETQRAQSDYLSALRSASSGAASQAANTETEAASNERIGDMVLSTDAKPLVLEYRRSKSVLAPNFSGYIDRLGEIRRDIQSDRAKRVVSEAGISQI